MDENKKHNDDTIAVHAGRRPMENFGVVNPPVYHASTILHPTVKSWEGRKEGTAHKVGRHSVMYGRMGTPTQFALRDALTELEGAADTELLPSGMSACAQPFMALAAPGAHFLIPDNVYLPVRSLGSGYLTQLGCEITFYDPAIGSGISDLIRPETKMVWTEAPGSLTFEMPDLRAIIAAAKEKGVLTGIDNTWGAGYFLKPIALGIDFSAHALTKYPCGHSDAMLGSVSCATQELYELIHQTVMFQGIGVSPDDCYLVQRGLRTMPTRLMRHHENGIRIAQWLAERPEVVRVLHPALPGDPGHEIWKRDFTGACGLFGAVIKAPDRDRLVAMVEGYELFGIGASWGGFESLCITSYPEKIRTATDWPQDGQVLRYHIGLEDPEDLIRDLERGFDRLAGK
ncbi:MAG: cystathionine beta-lyase [Alphaproteobacteria bacterium]|nr:cystathionine beta-lyase [Alphaproteobacteria bacterium]